MSQFIAHQAKSGNFMAITISHACEDVTMFGTTLQ